MMTPATIVACNIYITAASSHSTKLLGLLRRAQDQCRELRHQHKDDLGRSSSCAAKIENASSRSSSSKMIAPIAIVHAYADTPYDRSSFHLAGTPDCVSAVARTLICNALDEIDLDCTNTNSNKDEQSNEMRHPFVGLVDHVSIMSVDQHIPSTDNDNNSNCEAAAKAAREIGKRISATNLANVHYYGRACPSNTSLATVRRERTSFFKSGGAIDGKEQSSKDTPAVSKTLALQGDTTIGTS